MPWWNRKAEVTVDDSASFRKWDEISINGEGTFIVTDITSTTLTIKTLRWWHRLWRWVRRLWGSLWGRDS